MGIPKLLFFLIITKGWGEGNANAEWGMPKLGIKKETQCPGNSAFPIPNSALKRSYAFSILTLAPSATFLKTLASAVIFPITFTALAGRTSFPRLTGVGPKKMQKALPLGQ
jgi:hypothetical protein